MRRKKRLMGDNSVNILDRIMVLVHCPSSDCHLSINQFFFQSLLYFPRLPLIVIYLYTKFYLNVNSSFKVICRTRYRTDRRTDGQTEHRLYASTFGEHNKTFYLTHIISEEKIHTVCWHLLWFRLPRKSMKNSASNMKSASYTDSWLLR